MKIEQILWQVMAKDGVVVHCFGLFCIILCHIALFCVFLCLVLFCVVLRCFQLFSVVFHCFLSCSTVFSHVQSFFVMFHCFWSFSVFSPGKPFLAIVCHSIYLVKSCRINFNFSLLLFPWYCWICILFTKNIFENVWNVWIKK